MKFFFLSFFPSFAHSFIHSFISFSFSFDDDILAWSLASGVCERYTVVGREGVGSFSYESSCWSFFCWCRAGALGLSGLFACAEGGSVKLFSWFRGAVAWSEMSIRPLALPRGLPFSLPWI